MGWDITYHPVADSEIRGLYFRALEDATLVEPLQQQFRIEPFYMEQLQERIDEARSISADVPFEKGHAWRSWPVTCVGITIFAGAPFRSSSTIRWLPAISRTGGNWCRHSGRTPLQATTCAKTTVVVCSSRMTG